MKPIQPGCLAIVTGANFHTETIGEVVTCVRRADERDPFALPGSWVLDSEPQYCQERFLMRIDGGEDEGVTEHTDDEVTA